MSINHKYLFLSIKPEFANKILAKEKTIELRKQRPHISVGDFVIIYASSPIKKVVGYARIKSIIESSPRDIWQKYHNLLGIDEDRYNNYYNGHCKAIGIELERIRHCTPISLLQLHSIDINFRPPQGFRYISNNHISAAIETFIKAQGT